MRLIAVMLAALSMCGTALALPLDSGTFITALDSGAFTTALGDHAMADYTGTGHDILALGNFTQVPNGVSNYVNLDNIICLHDGKSTVCPGQRVATAPTPANIMEVIQKVATEFQDKSDPVSRTDSRTDTARSMLAAIGAELQDGNHNDAIGVCAGPASRTAWSTHGNLLLGASTTSPNGVSNFVNTANTICFWRDTLNTAPCPSPVTPEQCSGH